MSRVKYKGIRNYKMNIENIKNVIKQQIFMEPGHIDPLELRPREKEKKKTHFISSKKMLLCDRRSCRVVENKPGNITASHKDKLCKISYKSGSWQLNCGHVL